MSPRDGRLRRALDHQYAAAITVAVGAAVALVWAALSSSAYHHVVVASWFSGHEVGLRVVALNGVMTVFFAAVGLELSREVRANLRHHLRSALSPLGGALGGMAGTALLSVAVGLTLHSSALRRGWGVPMATDIAFTLGVLALAGPRVPVDLRLFLLTLAIADDVVSVVVLSVTGVTHVRVVALAVAALVAVLGLYLGRHAPPTLTFFLVAVPLWFAFAWAGVEPALSGVLAGLVVPVASATSRRLEVVVTRWSTAVALPLFAVVACGVTWSSLSATGATGTIIAGTVFVRLVGKFLGITGGVLVAELLGARRPAGLTLAVLAGATLLCAIGFTVPLLFAGALFGATSATYNAYAVGLFGASVIGALAGVAILRRATRAAR